MHRHDHAQRRVDVFELFAREAEADVVHPGAAVLRRARRPRAVRAPPSAEGSPRSNLCARSSSRICGATSRAAHSRTDLLEQALLLGEVEVEHQTDGDTGAVLAGSGALRKRTSRRFVLSRNCSAMRSGSNRRWMSRFGNGRCLARAAAYGRCCRFSLSTTICRVYSGLRPGGGSAVPKNASSTPSGRSIRTSCSASGCRRFLIKVVEDVPAQDAVDTARLLREPLHQERRKLVEKTSRT